MRFKINGTRKNSDSSITVSSTIRALCDTIVNLRCLEMLHIDVPSLRLCKVAQLRDMGMSVGLSALWNRRRAF